jgi:hypothetical protein
MVAQDGASHANASVKGAIAERFLASLGMTAVV